EAAVDAAVFGGFFNAGECCNAGSRLIVHEAIADEFLAEVRKVASGVKIGDPLDETTRVGAMISADHLGKVRGYVENAVRDGGTLSLGGERIAANAGDY